MLFESYVNLGEAFDAGLVRSIGKSIFTAYLNLYYDKHICVKRLGNFMKIIYDIIISYFQLILIGYSG